MNKIFIFYPHCYLKSTDKEILVFDTVNNEHVYIKDILLSDSDKETFMKGFVYYSKKLYNFINQCKLKDLGYFYNFENIPPYMHNRDMEFVTSLYKERKALGYNLQSYTNLLLKEVTILLNNDKDSYTNEMCLQMVYPQYNNIAIDLDKTLQQLSSFPSIENIVLSGDLDLTLLTKVIEYAKERDIFVTYRMLYDSERFVNIASLLKSLNNLSIELLVDSSVDIEMIRSIKSDKLYLKAIIQTNNDINNFQKIDNIIYLPILSFSKNNESILNQMILSEEEVLNTHKPLKDCLMSDFINTNEYGHLVIDYNGYVFCLGEKIASIEVADLSSIVNAWVGQNNCMWYYTRKKKELCKSCALQNLCPPISIYEKMGFYKCPCKI